MVGRAFEDRQSGIKKKNLEAGSYMLIGRIYS